jgi:hypothetical protein
VFGVISLVRDADGEASHLSQWAGLAKRSPTVALVMSFLLLALAGIPLTSGFTAKFAVFAAAIADGMAPLVVVALVASAVAAFFYIRVIVLMYFSEPAADGPTVTVPGAFTTAAITLGVLLTLLLGIVPHSPGLGRGRRLRRLRGCPPTRSPVSRSTTRNWPEPSPSVSTGSRSCCTARCAATTPSSPRPPCT